MKRKHYNPIITAALIGTLILPLSGCGTPSVNNPDSGTPAPTIAEGNVPVYGTNRSSDLLAGITANPTVTSDTVSAEAVTKLTELGISLFQKSLNPTENTLISPLSIQYALALTANGARENTLAQMEALFGMTTTELNNSLSAYQAALSSDEECHLNLANSIWFRDADYFTPNAEFLQTSVDYYDAGVFKAPFDDTTLTDINAWVFEHTAQMIPDMLDKIPEDVVTYLINALAFEAEWLDIYRENEIYDENFTKESGDIQLVPMMHSKEFVYLEDEDTTGFLKHYKGQNYAFAVLLPEEGISIADYVASLTAEKLTSLLASQTQTTVYTSLPKFKADFSLELVDILKSLGMTDAFSETEADLSGLGSSSLGNLSISRILHKTFITVDEKGTKAGAATVVAVTNKSILMNPKEVYLNRPFVYLLIDCEHNLPIFMGTLMEVETP